LSADATNCFWQVSEDGGKFPETATNIVEVAYLFSAKSVLLLSSAQAYAAVSGSAANRSRARET